MAAPLGVGVVSAAPAVVWPAPDYENVAPRLAGLFAFLRLDPANPLGRWIRPGMRVLVKPNWVKHESGETVGQHVLYTGTSLLRALIDVALTAVGPRGHVTVADAPLQGCDFARFRSQSGLSQLERIYTGAPVSFLDLRRRWAEIDDTSSYVRAVREMAGDPAGYSLVDLGIESRLAALDPGTRFEVTDYHPETTNGHHNGAHRYLVANSVLSADVIVNVPKLKTHMKTGLTGALKNFVGIIGSKDCLPHYRAGSPAEGGDEFPTFDWASRAARPVREMLQGRAPLWLWKMARAGAHAMPRPVIQGGAWHGNDTLWRTVHDLVNIARNYGPEGVRLDRSRTILTVVDAIIAGEGAGPLKPRPKNTGLLVWGEDPGIVDVACATLMGFDWTRIPILAHLRDDEARAFTGFSGALDFRTPTPEWDYFVRAGVGQFLAPEGWVGDIEYLRNS